MNNRVKLFIPAAFFIVMLSLLWYGLEKGKERDLSLLPSALINRPLPEFSKPDLFDPAKTIDSSMLRGSIFLVNVWATWCPPCHAEHPYLMEISERESDITLVGINYKDDVEDAREFLDERGNPFTYSLIDPDGHLGIDMGITAPPETFIVDTNGTIRYRHVGEINNRVWQETFLPVLEQLR